MFAAALACMAPLAAHAAGLGKLNVLSPLGQRLNAEIEIVALRPGEEDGLTARIAPPEAFAAAGIEPSAALNSIRFNIERRDGRRILRVTSTQPINDPFVELLVELQWQTGRLVREYTFLLDPPEYKAREIAAASPPKPAMPIKPAETAPAAPAPAAPAPAVPAPAAPPALAPDPKPAPQVEAKPMEPAAPPPQAAEPAKEPAKEEPAREPAKEEPAKQEPAKEEAAKPGADDPKVHEVMKGDTLGKIARDNLPPGVTLNQMLVAIYRANQDAFLRENVNLVRAGRILNIPPAEALGTVDVDEANRIVRAHMAEFRDYRSRLAAAPATADAATVQRESAGPIDPKPEAPKPPAAQDQVRLSKVDPQKPSAAAAAAARGDDLAARERALKEAQSRISDLEKNVADLQKLLELKNQQLAELERKAGAKPAPAAPAPAPAPPAPVAQAPEAPKPAAPAPAAPKPPAPAAKPAPKPVAAPPPEPSLLDEFLDNPVALPALGAVLILLLLYAGWAWRKKKTAQARFTDSVIGAAAAGATISEPTLGSATPAASQSMASTPPAGMAAEEVDPIAEADVYMAYGRDAQAEEILKEALQKDPNRIAVHSKLLEIYAKRRDTTAFEQTAARLKGVTSGTGPEWEKAAALGKSIDPNNGLYAGAAAAAAVAMPAAAASGGSAPTLDFDIGGASQVSPSVPDLTLDAPKPEDTGLDFDVSGATEKKDISGEETVIAQRPPETGGGLDFDLDVGSPATAAPAAPEKKPEPAADPGLTFDLNLDLGGENKAEAPPAPAPDLSTISLDLGSADSASAPTSGTDPKWQEIATKLDLAKAYEEMGDKDGARELLNEVMKDGDAAQKGQAQQLLAKLG